MRIWRRRGVEGREPRIHARCVRRARGGPRRGWVETPGEGRDLAARGDGIGELEAERRGRRGWRWGGFWAVGFVFLAQARFQFAQPLLQALDVFLELAILFGQV